jgi:hypothetical protein
MAQAIQDTTLGVQEDITKLHQAFASLRIGMFYTPLLLGNKLTSKPKIVSVKRSINGYQRLIPR